MKHTELCKRTAERFVKTMAIYESTMLLSEKPDVLNFDSSGRTWLYEIKMSRSDFLADRKKYCREEHHIGQFGDYRYFVCDGDFIRADEIPEGWGLYHFNGGKFHKIKEADRRCFFLNADDVSLRQKRNVELLVNFIICERTNIVFHKRVLENRVKYGKKETAKVEEMKEREALAEAREIIRQIVIVSNLKTGKEQMLPTELFVRAENFLKIEVEK
ncbi:MAG: hypothetical protein J5930_09355 [Treponema sp.]|nr:hypothetical protein [Treponema sp.]MBO5608086.1 hypothetical protein [Treponema sp.]